MPRSTAAALPIRIRVSRYLEAIFPTYLGIQGDYLDELDRALADADLAAVQRLGHTIRGGAATYELPPAADLGGRLEEAALAGDLSAASAIGTALRDFFARLHVTFAE